MGIHVQVIPFVREPSPLADIKALRALHSLFRERRYHIVHSHTPKAGLLAPVAARLARTRVVVHTVHGLLFHSRSRVPEAVLGAACEFWTAGFAQRLLSQSREDIDVMRRVHLKAANRVAYIGNGIDVRRFCPASSDDVRQRVRAQLRIAPHEVVVGMVGRLVREKGFLEYATAMRQLMAEQRQARALIVGPIDPGQSDGLDPPHLLDQLDPRRAIVLGHRDDLPEIYAAMDIFALPSYREGVPRTLMEASAMALPVVATDIRGCREVVDPGITGLLCPPREVGPLQQAISTLVAAPELRLQMGAAGRKRIETYFDANMVLDRLAAYYRDLVHREKLEDIA
jgi:glycosyltransferase involved in cell wall biosynthesis